MAILKVLQIKFMSTPPSWISQNTFDDKSALVQVRPTSLYGVTKWKLVNTLWPQQDGCHFEDKAFKCFFLNGKFWISIQIWLIFVAQRPIDETSVSVQLIAWQGMGDKPLPEPIMLKYTSSVLVGGHWYYKAFEFEFESVCPYKTYIFIQWKDMH